MITRDEILATIKCANRADAIASQIAALCERAYNGGLSVEEGSPTYDEFNDLWGALSVAMYEAMYPGIGYATFDDFLAEHPANRFGKAPTRMQCFIAYNDVLNAFNTAMRACARAEARYEWMLQRKELTKDVGRSLKRLASA